MPKITHDPARGSELDREQWFADIIGGMFRRSARKTNVYSYERMVNIYGRERTARLVETYEALRAE
jgi:hypothetical protein